MKKSDWILVFLWVILAVWLILFGISNIMSVIDESMCDRISNLGDYLFLTIKCTYQNQNFNPDTDVCEWWGDLGWTYNQIPNEWQKEHCDLFKYYELYQMSRCEECKGWRPKTKCELDPNSEDCVCDLREERRWRGYILCYRSYPDVDGGRRFENISESEKEEVISNYKSDCEAGFESSFFTLQEEGDCIKAHEKPKPIKIDLEKDKCAEHLPNEAGIDSDVISAWGWEQGFYICGDLAKDKTAKEMGLYDKYCCLKTEQKNECEKGNPKWIWQDTRMFSIYNNITLVSGCIESIYDHKKGGCIPNRFCRKKTDLELFKEELNKYDCDKLALQFIDKCRWGICKYNFYRETDSELKKYFVLKGCKI